MYEITSRVSRFCRMALIKTKGQIYTRHVEKFTHAKGILLPNVVRKLPIIREKFKGDHNVAVVLSGTLNYIFHKVYTHITTVFNVFPTP